MPKVESKRINLDVDVRFRADGTMDPRMVTYHEQEFPVKTVVGLKSENPRQINCLDLLEYTTIICGREKKLYYEFSTNTWFSFKKYVPVKRSHNRTRPG